MGRARRERVHYRVYGARLHTTLENSPSSISMKSSLLFVTLVVLLVTSHLVVEAAPSKGGDKPKDFRKKRQAPSQCDIDCSNGLTPCYMSGKDYNTCIDELEDCQLACQ